MNKSLELQLGHNFTLKNYLVSGEIKEVTKIPRSYRAGFGEKQYWLSNGISTDVDQNIERSG